MEEGRNLRGHAAAAPRHVEALRASLTGVLGWPLASYAVGRLRREFGADVERGAVLDFLRKEVDAKRVLDEWRGAVMAATAADAAAAVAAAVTSSSARSRSAAALLIMDTDAVASAPAVSVVGAAASSSSSAEDEELMDEKLMDEEVKGENPEDGNDDDTLPDDDMDDDDDEDEEEFWGESFPARAEGEGASVRAGRTTSLPLPADLAAPSVALPGAVDARMADSRPAAAPPPVAAPAVATADTASTATSSPAVDALAAQPATMDEEEDDDDDIVVVLTNMRPTEVEAMQAGGTLVENLRHLYRTSPAARVLLDQCAVVNALPSPDALGVLLNGLADLLTAQLQLTRHVRPVTTNGIIVRFDLKPGATLPRDCGKPPTRPVYLAFWQSDKFANAFTSDGDIGHFPSLVGRLSSVSFFLEHHGAGANMRHATGHGEDVDLNPLFTMTTVEVVVGGARATRKVRMQKAAEAIRRLETQGKTAGSAAGVVGGSGVGTAALVGGSSTSAVPAAAHDPVPTVAGGDQGRQLGARIARAGGVATTTAPTAAAATAPNATAPASVADTLRLLVDPTERAKVLAFKRRETRGLLLLATRREGLPADLRRIADQFPRRVESASFFVRHSQHPDYPNIFLMSIPKVYEGILGVAQPKVVCSVFCHRGGGRVQQTRVAGAAITLADPSDLPIGLLYDLRIVSIIDRPDAPVFDAPPADIDTRVVVVPEPQRVLDADAHILGPRPKSGLLLLATRREGLPADLRRIADQFPRRVESASFFVRHAQSGKYPNVFATNCVATYKGILGVEELDPVGLNFSHRGGGRVQQTRVAGAAITLADPSDLPIGLLYDLRIVSIIDRPDAPVFDAPPADIDTRVVVVPEPQRVLDADAHILGTRPKSGLVLLATRREGLPADLRRIADQFPLRVESASFFVRHSQHPDYPNIFLMSIPKVYEGILGVAQPKAVRVIFCHRGGGRVQQTRVAGAAITLADPSDLPIGLLYDLRIVSIIDRPDAPVFDAPPADIDTRVVVVPEPQRVLDADAHILGTRPPKSGLVLLATRREGLPADLRRIADQFPRRVESASFFVRISTLAAYPNVFATNTDAVYEGILGVAQPKVVTSVFCHRGGGRVQQTRMAGAAITLADPTDLPIGLLYDLRITRIIDGGDDSDFPAAAPPADIDTRVVVVPEPQSVLDADAHIIGPRPKSGLLLLATRRDGLPADLRRIADQFPLRVESASFFVRRCTDVGYHYNNIFLMSIPKVYEGILGVAQPKVVTSVFCHRGGGRVQQTRKSGAAITLADPTDLPIGLLYDLRIVSIIDRPDAPVFDAPPADIDTRVVVVPEPGP
jgi:hypothetical protein